MIFQGFLDWFRDVQVNWLSGLNSMMDAVGADTAASAVGAAGAGAGRFLALFIGNGSWPAVLSAFGAYALVWLATGLIAVVSRRFTAS